jgi:hypothetical protein
MTCTRDSLYLKVNPVFLRNLLDVSPRMFFRRGGDRKCMVGYELPYRRQVSLSAFQGDVT